MILPLAILSASLAGSLHCVGMCGGLILSTTTTKLSKVYYHLARLLGYLVFGAIAGSIGAKVFAGPVFGWLSVFAASLVGLILIFYGIRIIRGRPVHLSILSKVSTVAWSKIVANRAHSPNLSATAAGLCTALLPCGWLHAFILTGATTGSAFGGMSVLFFFWIGTLPALWAAPQLMEKIFTPMVRMAPKASAFLLIFIGILSVGLKLQYLDLSPNAEAKTTKAKHSCH